MNELKRLLVERWQDPCVRIQDTFNVQRADGGLVPFVIPQPQRPIIQEGLLGTGVNYINSGHVLTTVTNKCRQAGFSVITAAEAILVCQDFPRTSVYYCAPTNEQVSDWMTKLDQLVNDANHYPEQLGGNPIISNAILDNVFTKHINGAHIVGLGANPANIRGKTGIMLILDEMDWMIRFKDQMEGTYTAAKYFVRQGGVIRCLSTPRVKDSQFGIMCTDPEKHGVVYHECPAISNWRQLNLQEPLYIDMDNRRRKMQKMRELTRDEMKALVKRYRNKPMFVLDKENKVIYQKAEIPYPWIPLQQLSVDCQADLEKFLQENCCVAVDEAYKLLNSEWIYQNINDDGQTEDRGDSMNSFYMGMDFAKKKDLTAITVVENVDGVFWERYIDESQHSYDAQIEKIWDIFIKYRPIKVAIDDTGLGEVLGDLLEKKLRDAGLGPQVLVRVKFNQSTKENMALQAKEIIRQGKYKFLNQNTMHERAIRHCTRVEKEVLDTMVRYSGKMHGRDDHFWSKALLTMAISGATPVVKSTVRSFKRIHGKQGSARQSGQHIIDELHKQQADMAKDETKPSQQAPMKKFFTNITKVDGVIDELRHHKRMCVMCGKMVNLLYACVCSHPSCPNRIDAERMCRKHDINPDDVRDRQTYYEVKSDGQN